MSETLSNLSREERRFEPPADLAANANVKEEAYDRAASDRDAFWGAAAERLDWGQRWDQVLDWSNPPFAKWFVGGTLNAAVNCVDRHVDAGNGDKVAIHWVGEPEDDTRDITYADLMDQVSRAANALSDLGVQQGRPGRDLHADDPRGRGRDAGLRAPRRPAHRGLRWLLRRRPRVPRHRLRGEGHHHRRRWLPPRCAERAEAGRGRGRGQGRGQRGTDHRRARRRRTPHRPGRRLGRQPRRLVARRRRRRVARARRRDARLRAPALRHVHVRHDRYAEGHPAHDRRLPHRHVLHALGGLRPQGRRRLLVHRRRRVGDRPQLHGLRSARQRRHPGDVRRHAGRPAQGPLVGDHREVRRDHLLHRADRDPDLHEVGRRPARRARPVLDPPARLGRGVDQSRGLHLVQEAHRLGPGSHRRHLVADRDRADHGQPAARSSPPASRARP